MNAHAPSPKPHKAVVFDLGMVLIHVAYSRSAKALAPHCEVGPDVVQSALDQSPLLHAFESGRIPFSSFVSEFRATTGYRGDDATFRALFADIFHPLPEMIDFLGALHAEGVPAYLLSNTNEIAAEHVDRSYPFYRLFNGHVLSHEVGCMKPKPPIYEAVEIMSGLSGPGLFFIDDRPENVEAALARGWHGIVHSDPHATIASCRRWLAGPPVSEAGLIQLGGK